ncbi:MAG: NUDIX hydrolase [Bacilli bacterium]|nr:NUDIX hydrolase [Bacilli bacterium]
MKNVFHFEDYIYPFTYTDHKRIVLRAVLLNENNKVALLHVVSDDKFGHRDCFELPGGGKKPNEGFHQGVLREIEEETGYKGKILTFLAKVEDYYNLIHRNNHNYYYLVRTTNYVGEHKEEYEKKVIQELRFVDIDKAIELMNNVEDDGVGLLIKQRELPILKLAKEYIDEHPINK